MRLEPDDMRRASFFCCVEEVKVELHWSQPIHCPRCGSEHHGGHRHSARRLELDVEPAQA
jgi:hypothetical protein